MLPRLYKTQDNICLKICKRMTPLSAAKKFPMYKTEFEYKSNFHFGQNITSTLPTRNFKMRLFAYYMKRDSCVEK